jgi:hypothetical protein
LDDLRRLAKTADMAGAEKRVLVSRTVESASGDGVHSVDLAGALRLLEAQEAHFSAGPGNLG